MTPPVESSHDWVFKRLSDARALLGESPVWESSANAVCWVDIDGSKVFRTDAECGDTAVWAAPEFAGCVAVSVEGAVMVGMESGLFRLDTQTGVFDRVMRLERKGVRFNDSTVDAAGNLWAATMDVANVEPIGTVYRIGLDLSATEVMSGFTTPNGLAVDARRGRLYVSDSHASVQTVWWHPLDLRSGAVGDRRTFFPMREFNGRPDGAALDALGNYWIAGVGGSALHKLDPDGNHLAEIRTPMPAPTKIAFGGKDLDQVFLTSKTDEGGGVGGYLMVAETPENGADATLFGSPEETNDLYSSDAGK